jgi:hypothetical protein
MLIRSMDDRTSIPITSLINCIPRFFAHGVIYGQLVFVYFSLSLSLYFFFSSSFLIKEEGGWCWMVGYVPMCN